MSAAEKLNALHDADTDDLEGWFGRLAALYEVLPQLVNVLEAAEAEMREVVKPPRGKFPTEDALRDSIDALDQALSTTSDVRTTLLP